MDRTFVEHLLATFNLTLNKLFFPEINLKKIFATKKKIPEILKLYQLCYMDEEDAIETEHYYSQIL